MHVESAVEQVLQRLLGRDGAEATISMLRLLFATSIRVGEHQPLM